LLRAAGPEVLTDEKIRHVAIANPALAPYGAAARQVLARLGLAEVLAGKLVMGQNVGEAYSMIATGNAEAGFVALASVHAAPAPLRGSHWAVPATLHDPIRQDAVLLSHGAGNAAARAFLDYLRTPAARDLMQRYGYRTE
ncbi:MAG: molybdate ABC transporter substrate-binding protein, partial [Gammaproteobacteria bacterium]